MGLYKTFKSFNQMCQVTGEEGRKVHFRLGCSSFVTLRPLTSGPWGKHNPVSSHCPAPGPQWPSCGALTGHPASFQSIPLPKSIPWSHQWERSAYKIKSNLPDLANRTLPDPFISVIHFSPSCGLTLEVLWCSSPLTSIPRHALYCVLSSGPLNMQFHLLECPFPFSATALPIHLFEVKVSSKTFPEVPQGLSSLCPCNFPA